MFPAENFSLLLVHRHMDVLWKKILKIVVFISSSLLKRICHYLTQSLLWETANDFSRVFCENCWLLSYIVIAVGVQQHLYFNKSELCRSEEVNRTSNIKVCLKGRRIWKNILFHNVFFYIVASFPLSEKLQKPNLVYPPISFEALQPLLPLWARSRFCQIVPAEPESSTEKGSPILFLFSFLWLTACKDK